MVPVRECIDTVIDSIAGKPDKGASAFLEAAAWPTGCLSVNRAPASTQLEQDDALASALSGNEYADARSWAIAIPVCS